MLLNLDLAVEWKAFFPGKEIASVLVNDKILSDFNLGLSLPFFSHCLLLLCFGVPVKSENSKSCPVTTLSDAFVYVRRKLKEWREAKGISYKRPPMPVKAQVKRAEAVLQPFWITMKEKDDAHSLIRAVDRSLADCIKLLEEVSLI